MARRMARILAKDLGKFERKLKRKLPQVIRQLHEKTAREAVSILKEQTRKIRPHPPVTSRRLILGWFVQRLPRLGIVIGNREDYAGYVEGGRRKGAPMPPVSAIRKWVRLKFGYSGAQARSTAFVIARSISKKGIKPKPIVKRSFPKIVRLYRKNLRDANRKWFS